MKTLMTMPLSMLMTMTIILDDDPTCQDYGEFYNSPVNAEYDNNDDNDDVN